MAIAYGEAECKARGNNNNRYSMRGASFLSHAGYYSYLYARCLSASIWHRLCEAEPLSLETGEKLRRGFLEHGGAKDAAQMITNCLGPDVLTRSSCDSRGVKPCIEQLLCELDL